VKSSINRFTTWFVSLYPRKKWGLAENILSKYLVENLGPLGALRWTMQNGPRADRTVKEWGGMRANLLFAMASLLNGCSYCLFAHARAFELYYFEKHDKLFPLDQHDFLSLIPLTDQASRERLEQALTAAGLSSEIETFRRLYALKLEGATPRPGDENLVHAIQMYDMLNYCSIEGQIELDDAHDIINKNQELKTRYAAARLAMGRRKVFGEDLAAIEEATRAAKSRGAGGSDGNSGE